VILEHDHPYLHWDLLIESGDVLYAWRLSECPAPGRRVSAERIPDHRSLYLNYEGRVSGDRGTVARVCAGQLDDGAGTNSYHVLDSSPISLKRCCLEIDSDGSGDDVCWWVFE